MNRNDKSDADRIREALNEALALAGQEPDEFVTAASRAILETVEW